MRHPKLISSFFLTVVTTVITVLSSCSSDPRTKAIEDLYLQFRSGDFYIEMIEANKDRLEEQGSYKSAMEKAKISATALKVANDERYGAYKGMEVIDTVSTNDYKGIVYYVRFKNAKEDVEDYFLLEKDDEGNWKAGFSNEISYNTDKSIQNIRKADAQAETDGFPASGLWYVNAQDGYTIFFDFDSREKSFKYYDEKCNGFMVIQNEYGKQVNVIDDIKITGNTADVKFVNLNDYNTYTLKLTYNHADRSLTISDLKLVEQNPDFNKYLLDMPDCPIKLNRDNGNRRYSIE